MIGIIKDYSGNNYRIPHMGKKRLERQEALPTQLDCKIDIVEKAYFHLLQQDPLDNDDEAEEEQE